MNMNRNFWKCPKCEREFSKKNQWHSCVSISINKHFMNKPPILEAIFNSLREKVEEFGQIRINAVKTSINIGGKSHFSTLYILGESIKLDFLLKRRIQSPRMIRVRGPTNNYYTYTFVSTDNNNDPIKYIIDWRDGFIDESEFLPNGTIYNISHKWETVGSYTIIATASDNQTISTSEITIKIEDTYPEEQNIVLIYLAIISIILIIILFIIYKRKKNR